MKAINGEKIVFGPRRWVRIKTGRKKMKENIDSELHRMILDSVKRIIKEEILPDVKRRDEKGEFPLDAMNRFAELGLLGLRIPKEYGGSGQGLFESVLVLEEVAKADASTAVNLHIQLNGPPIYILEFGNEEMKNRYLPSLCSGKILFSMAQTEPDAGSSLADIKTLARPDGKNYIVNGKKVMIAMGKRANAHLVYVRFHDDNSIGCLIVQKETAGFSTGSVEDFLGLKGLESSELIFQDCPVPMENVLIKGHGAFQKMMSMFNGARIGLASISLGIAEAAFEDALRYTKVRIISGRPLMEFQGIQWKIAEMAIKIEAMRNIIHTASQDRSNGGYPGPFLSSIAKIMAAEGALKVTNMAMDIFGAYGYSKEYPIERYLRDARGATFLGGTPEVLRNRIMACLKCWVDSF
jgi:alkylation response protein AidB-like acyl-CoA dehydrogenase